MKATERLNDIAVFVLVAERGSFTAAAEHIGLTKSAVGKAVARLEARLNVRLFHRTTRTLALSADGEAYYRSCLRATAELEAGEAALSSSRTEPGGRLRMDLPVAMGHQRIVPVLLELVARYPQISLDLSFNERLIDPVEEGVDLVVRIGDHPMSDALSSRYLGTQKLCVVAAPAYLEKHGTPLSLADATRHHCLSYCATHKSGLWTFQAAGGREIQQPAHIIHRVGDLQALMSAAIAGLGIAQMPDWLAASAIRDGRLRRILPDVPGAERPVYALGPRTRSPIRRVQVAIDALEREFEPDRVPGRTSSWSNWPN